VHRFWTIVLCLLALAVESRAQGDWPNRPIKIIVSQAAGSAPDIVCRYLAEWLSAGLGQQSIIENRPGGQNTIGAQAAARSPTDGYTTNTHCGSGRCAISGSSRSREKASETDLQIDARPTVTHAA
jgi:tripartite-type tricarboxylate transporter receptor subunit TctC